MTFPGIYEWKPDLTVVSLNSLSDVMGVKT
jgi:hypothetical protein